jgi:hypothetical protein
MSGKSRGLDKKKVKDTNTPRTVTGADFWRYKFQLEADRNLAIRKALLDAESTIADKQGKIGDLTQLSGQLQTEIATKEQEINNMRRRELEAERNELVKMNTEVIDLIGYDASKESITLGADQLIITPNKPGHAGRPNRPEIVK